MAEDKFLNDEIVGNLILKLGFDPRINNYVLITGHRRENFGAGFQNICNAISQLAAAFPETSFIYPVHLNPNVQKPVLDLLGDASNIHLISPLDYLSFLLLLGNCRLVLTDSGGIQEDATTI